MKDVSEAPTADAQIAALTARLVELETERAALRMERDASRRHAAHAHRRWQQEHEARARAEQALAVGVAQGAIGAQLRERRKAAGLSLAEAARAIGVSLGHLSNIERGQRADPVVMTATVARCCAYYGYTLVIGVRPALEEAAGDDL
jgi:DNA-binding XRE family transcriptional regulator